MGGWFDQSRGRFSAPSPRDVGADGALLLVGVLAIVLVAGLGLDLRPMIQALIDLGREIMHQAGAFLSQV